MKDRTQVEWDLCIEHMKNVTDTLIMGIMEREGINESSPPHITSTCKFSLPCDTQCKMFIMATMRPDDWKTYAYSIAEPHQNTAVKVDDHEP